MTVQHLLLTRALYVMTMQLGAHDCVPTAEIFVSSDTTLEGIEANAGIHQGKTINHGRRLTSCAHLQLEDRQCPR